MASLITVTHVTYPKFRGRNPQVIVFGDNGRPILMAAAVRHYWDTNTDAFVASQAFTIKQRQQPDSLQQQTGDLQQQVSGLQEDKPRSTSSAKVYFYCRTSLLSLLLRPRDHTHCPPMPTSALENPWHSSLPTLLNITHFSTLPRTLFLPAGHLALFYSYTISLWGVALRLLTALAGSTYPPLSFLTVAHLAFFAGYALSPWRVVLRSLSALASGTSPALFVSPPRIALSFQAMLAFPALSLSVARRSPIAISSG